MSFWRPGGVRINRRSAEGSGWVSGMEDLVLARGPRTCRGLSHHRRSSPAFVRGIVPRGSAQGLAWESGDPSPTTRKTAPTVFFGAFPFPVIDSTVRAQRSVSLRSAGSAVDARGTTVSSGAVSGLSSRGFAVCEARGAGGARAGFRPTTRRPPVVTVQADHPCGGEDRRIFRRADGRAAATLALSETGRLRGGDR